MKRTSKVIVSVILVTLFVCSSLVAVSADTFAGYKEYQGSVALISNFEEGKVSEIGVADPLGKSMTAKEYGETDEYCGDVGTKDISISKEHFLQGNSALKMHVAYTESLENYQNGGTEFDKTTLQIRNISNTTIPSNVSNVYLCFYLYVEKKDYIYRLNLELSCIELANKIDNIEYGFDFKTISGQIKNDGWNKIELPFSKAGSSGISGAMDLKRLRIYLFSAGVEDVDLYFDNMAIETIGKPTSSNTSSTVSSKPVSSSTTGSKKPSSSTTVSKTSSISSVTSTESKVSSVASEISSAPKTSSISVESASTSTQSQQPDKEEGNSWLWIIISACAVVVAGGITAVVILVKKK